MSFTKWFYSSFGRAKCKKGELIGRVGHSENSYAPHLHFQLMDSEDIKTANGLPCAFEQYEIYQENKWKTILNGIPTDKDKIRFEENSMRSLGKQRN